MLRTFGLGTPVGVAVETARGAMGRIFRVETSTGVWALKELFDHGHGYDPSEHLERQASFIKAARDAGVAAPQIIRSLDGSIVSSIDGAQWRAFEWIDIAGPSTLQQAGAALARLHGVGWPTAEAVDPCYRHRTVGGSWENLLARARHQPWASLLRDQIPELTALDAIAERATLPPCRMCHRDYNESNVAVDRAGQVVVLDWDNCGPLPPEWEVAFLLVDGGREHIGPPIHVSALAPGTRRCAIAA